MILRESHCGNCYQPGQEIRTGVGQLKVVGWRCSTPMCRGYTWHKKDRPWDHQTDRSEYAGYSHACGYFD